MNRNTCCNQNMMMRNAQNAGAASCPARMQGRQMMRRDGRMNMPCDGGEMRCEERREMPCGCGEMRREERREMPCGCGEMRREERREMPCDGGEMRREERREMPCGCGEMRRTERGAISCPLEDNWREEVPVGSRQKLLTYIDEVSFAVYDAMLYLDTHPNDEEALRYFRKHNEKRNFALRQYAKAYGPLNIGAMDDDASRSWEWACQMWPWEGGNC